MSTTTTKMTYKTITEGSTTMVYPADQEQTVFYNPVQVQNRDLSVLMIALYAERRRKRQALLEKKKELRKNEIQGDELDKQLEAYGNELKVQELIQQESKQGIHILDALAASGLRSIRYWKEIPGVKHVTINDLDQAATERAHANIEKNNLRDVLTDNREYGIRILNGDATHEMYMSRRIPDIQNPTPIQLRQTEQYDVIDLDPYGSAAPFLDGAVQAIKNGGMLNVTCTDMRALGGASPEICYSRYGSMPIPKAKYLQESALRILLKSLAETAAKYGRIIKPILSVGMNFYVRCFVEIHDKKAAVNALSLSVGTIYQSTQCPSFHTVPHGQFGRGGRNNYQPTRAPIVPRCEETGAPFKVGGPIWLGALHDQDVINEALQRLSSKDKGVSPDMKLLASRERLTGLLTSVSEELLDVPLYYDLPDMCHLLSCVTPPKTQIRAAIINAGYRVSGYHKDPQALKTDAPNKVLWDILRVWCQKNPPSLGKNKKKKEKKRKEKEVEPIEDGEKKEMSAGEKILSIQPSIEVDFTVSESNTKRSNVKRFPMNPEKHWGPKPMATGKRKRSSENEEDKKD